MKVVSQIIDTTEDSKSASAHFAQLKYPSTGPKSGVYGGLRSTACPSLWRPTVWSTVIKHYNSAVTWKRRKKELTKEQFPPFSRQSPLEEE